jgi:hypothetical protein
MIARPNRDQPAKLRVSHITAETPDGQIVVDWVDDLELSRAAGHGTDAITTTDSRTCAVGLARVRPSRFPPLDLPGS